MSLDLSDEDGTFLVRWINLDQRAWTETSVAASGEAVFLAAPDAGHWIAVLLASD